MLSAADRQDIIEAVSNGVDFFEREKPGWQHKIDLSLMDVADWILCPYGQVFETDGDSELDEDVFEVSLGFNIPPNTPCDEQDEYWDYLQLRWEDAIARRRGQEKA